MIITDSHCHVSASWYEPVESLLFQMDRNEVSHAILIQMQGQFDNAYQAECIRRFPGRFASVVVLDPTRPDACETLTQLADQGASGIRLRPGDRSPGDDPLALWHTAARLKLSVSCGGSSAAFTSDEFARLIESLPTVPIVIEHLGSVSRPDTDAALTERRNKVLDLARYPNVCIKVTGLGEFCHRASPAVAPFPFEEPIPPLLDLAYKAFGAERNMWGSDYPPVSAREGYANALRFCMERFPATSDTERVAAFGGTARRVFPIRA